MLFCTDRNCEANALQNDLLKQQLPTTFTVITGVSHRHELLKRQLPATFKVITGVFIVTVHTLCPSKKKKKKKRSMK